MNVIEVKDLTKSYKNLVAVDIYIDDGYTGTNFERPDFKRMLNDIEKEKLIWL